MLTLTAVGKGITPHQKPVVEDPVTKDEFSQQSVEKKKTNFEEKDLPSPPSRTEVLQTF